MYDLTTTATAIIILNLKPDFERHEGGSITMATHAEHMTWCRGAYGQSFGFKIALLKSLPSH